MLTSLIALIILSLFLGAGAWLFFLWGANRGEFDDPEEPKYRMLEDDDRPRQVDNTGREGRNGK